MPERINLGWTDIQLECEAIAKLVKESGIVVKQVFGLPRGGLIPAVILSHLLNVPLVVTKEQCRTDVLIVDDICDTGETFKNLVEHFKGMRYSTAVVVQLPGADFHPTFVGRAVSAHDWVEFPWETWETSKVDNTEIL